MGYKFQFVTLAGFHSLNLDVQAGARLSRARHGGLFGAAAGGVRGETEGYTATRHQREVGVGCFDAVAMAISGGQSSTTAMAGSTEAAQFHETPPAAAPAAPDHDDGLIHGHAWARSTLAEAAD